MVCSASNLSSNTVFLCKQGNMTLFFLIISFNHHMHSFTTLAQVCLPFFIYNYSTHYRNGELLLYKYFFHVNEKYLLNYFFSCIYLNSLFFPFMYVTLVISFNNYFEKSLGLYEGKYRILNNLFR